MHAQSADALIATRRLLAAAHEVAMPISTRTNPGSKPVQRYRGTSRRPDASVQARVPSRITASNRSVTTGSGSATAASSWRHTRWTGPGLPPNARP